jgi:hypothetical protein
MPGLSTDGIEVSSRIAVDFAAAAASLDQVPRDFFGMVVYESRLGTGAGNKHQGR